MELQTSLSSHLVKFFNGKHACQRLNTVDECSLSLFVYPWWLEISKKKKTLGGKNVRCDHAPWISLGQLPRSFIKTNKAD